MGRSAKRRKFRIKELPNPVKCRLVPIAVPLIPFFRHFFETMQSEGVWATKEEAARGKEYFSWQEAMMLCDIGQKLEENQQKQDRNFCTLVAVIVTALTEGAIPPEVAMTLCNVIRAGLEAGTSTPQWIEAQVKLLAVGDDAVGKKTNQIEPYIKKVAELIGGDGVVEDVD